MKKLLTLLLLSSILFSLVACGNTAQAPTQTTNAPPSQEPSTHITIDSTYSIVIPASATAYEQEAANTVALALSKRDITVQIKQDTEPAGDKEILIGKTSRAATQSVLSTLTDGAFCFTTNQRTVVLAANDESGSSLATLYFIYSFITGKESVTIPMETSLTHTKQSITLAGRPLSEYTVVYAKEGVGTNKDIESAKYADTVSLFVELLEKATGVRLPVVPDTRPDPAKPVILFGKTDYDDDNKLYSTKLTRQGIGAYAVKLTENGNIALAGTNPCSALFAGEAMIAAILGENKDITALDLSGKRELIRVACVGDSITYGTNSSDPSMQNYPTYLQRMLGYGYYVEKYGAPGHSLIETDTSSFLKHEYFQKSANAAPDVVIVMLGTNDCRTQHWEDSAYKNWQDPARKESFLSSGQKLIDAYRKKNPEVQIIFATCPTVPQDSWLGTDWTQRIMRYGNPSIKEIAKKNNCPVIDIFTYSRNHPEMLEGGDGLHPQNEQYEILAQGIYELSKDVIKK